jgi:hypothetical protein
MHHKSTPQYHRSITVFSLLEGILSVNFRIPMAESVQLFLTGRPRWSARTTNIIPALRDPAWALLGYDVCDQWLLSGLSNCGYGTNESEIQILRETYTSDLNEHHLFDALKPAVDFMHLSDERVPEHAPFFVFGIWLIKKEEGLEHPDLAM